jgi:hypothetical protein
MKVAPEAVHLLRPPSKKERALERVLEFDGDAYMCCSYSCRCMRSHSLADRRVEKGLEGDWTCASLQHLFSTRRSASECERLRRPEADLPPPDAGELAFGSSEAGWTGAHAALSGLCVCVMAPCVYVLCTCAHVCMDTVYYHASPPGSRQVRARGAIFRAFHVCWAL